MKRGQAALEFLTTYGWAFLVILVMIGALAYFGVLNPKGLLPSRCTFGPEIDCIEHQSLSQNAAGNSELQFRFRNNVGSTANFTFNATYLGGTNPETQCDDTSGAGGATQVQLGPGRLDEIFCTFSGAILPANDKAKFEVKGQFKKTDGSYWQVLSGDIFGDIK